LLLRDVAASSPTTAVAAPAAGSSGLVQEIIKQVVTYDGTWGLEEGLSLLGTVVEGPAAVFVTLSGLQGLLINENGKPGDPSGGSPGCASGDYKVTGGADQCELVNRPATCPLKPTEFYSCSLQNTHALPSVESHSAYWLCASPITPTPGRTCTKSRMSKDSPYCYVDCVQTYTSCSWAWCRTYQW
jgi:hypothetical protein